MTMSNDARNTFAPHPATLLDTPPKVMGALLSWRDAASRFVANQKARSPLMRWHAWQLSRAYVALRKVVLAQVDSTWYGSAMWLALDEGVNPFNDGLFIAFLVNALLP